MLVDELGHICVVRKIDPVHLANTPTALNSPLAAAAWYISGLDDLVVLRERMPPLRGHVLDRRHVFEIDRHEASRTPGLIRDRTRDVQGQGVSVWEECSGRRKN